jgi:hypothetical protein
MWNLTMILWEYVGNIAAIAGEISLILMVLTIAAAFIIGTYLWALTRVKNAIKEYERQKSFRK